MLKPNISKQATKFLQRLTEKYRRQLSIKVVELCKNPMPQDSKKLVGKKAYLGYYRADAGEFRIIYRVVNDVLEVLLIGRRNDGDIYKKFERA